MQSPDELRRSILSERQAELQKCGWCKKPMKDGQRAFLVDAGEWIADEYGIGPDQHGQYVCSKKCLSEGAAAWWPGRG